MHIGKKKFIACLAAAFLAGGAVVGAGAAFIKGGGSGDDADKYSKLDEIYKYIEAGYYEETDEDALLDGACKGLVSGLDDPYSSYMTADEYDSWLVSLEGEYSGIGVTFSQDINGNYIVVSVTKDSPAEAAGIKAGDVLLLVDDKAYDDMDLMAKAIRGKEGTKVKLTYARDNKENEAEITRKKIVQYSVEYEMIDDETGYIAISSFIDNTADEFEEALKAVEDKGAAKLVLDLRDNGGGLLTSCIKIADQFLDEGPVVYVEDKAKNRDQYDAEDGKTSLETVVLVNENSASAAEILAAALQDNGFKLVGQTTFGKGVIQSTVELDDGSALKLTIMQYFSPDGNAINKKGVTPDFKVKDSENEEKDPQLDKALDLLK